MLGNFMQSIHFSPLQKDLAQSWPLEPSGKTGMPLLTHYN